jgi:hypothetical protein
VSAVRPDPTILLLATVFPIVCTVVVVFAAKAKGFLFLDLGRREGKRPRNLAVPMLTVLALTMGSNALFHGERVVGGAWFVLGVAVIALSLTKSSREAKAEFLRRMQAELAKQEAPQ